MNMGRQDRKQGKTAVKATHGEPQDNVKQNGRLTNNTISYFKRVDQVLTEDAFDDEEIKGTFIRNVFAQVKEEGVQILRHTLTSKVLEKLIPLLRKEQFTDFLELIKEKIEMLCCDRFASHVIESVCVNYTGLYSVDSDHNCDLKEQFISFCKALRKIVNVLVRDTYGSHVISILLQVLSGVKVSDHIVKSRNSRNSKKKIKESYVVKEKELSAQQVTLTTVPKLSQKEFNKFTKSLIKDDNFGELLCHQNASPVLQVLLIATSHITKKKYGALSNQILQRAQMIGNEQLQVEEDEETIHKLPVVLTDQVGSHLIEVVLQTAGNDLCNVLSSQCFKNIIVSLCMHPVANFLAQTFLRLLKDTERAIFYVDKLLQFTEDILAAGHIGCIVCMVELIARLELVDKQKKFIKVISEALHIPRDENPETFLAKLLLSLMTYDIYMDNEAESVRNETEKADKVEIKLKRIKKDMINYHGACILKHCFKFKKSKILVKSFLKFVTEELVIIACNPYGSFAFESFYESQHIQVKNKMNLTKSLISSLYILASDKFGSRVVDALWKAADNDTQLKIKNRLNEFRFQLKSNLYGRIILTNCGLNQVPMKVSEKREKEERKRKLIEEFTTPSTPVESKPKKKIKEDDRALKYREQLKQLGISFEPDD